MFRQTWTLLQERAISQHPGVFMSCLVQLNVLVISVFCLGENQLLELHKSSLRALMAFLGIRRLVPHSTSSKAWGWQAKQQC